MGPRGLFKFVGNWRCQCQASEENCMVFWFQFLDQIINAFVSTLTELVSADLKILQELCDKGHKEARRRGVAEKQQIFLAPRMSSKRICKVCTCSFIKHWYQYSCAVDTCQFLRRHVSDKFVCVFVCLFVWHTYKQTELHFWGVLHGVIGKLVIYWLQADSRNS